MTSGPHTDPSLSHLDAVAWRFLGSEFAGASYGGWPIDRRIEVFLSRNGLQSLLDDGTVCEALTERILANVGRAVRCGLLTRPADVDVP